MRREWMTSWGVVSAALLGACSVHGGAAGASGPETDASSVEFLRLTPDPDRIRLTGRLEGRLTLDGPCLRLAGGGRAVTLVWAPTAELTTHHGRIAVQDRDTGRMYTVGERVVLGGGLVDQIAPGELDLGRPPACGGPYYVTSFPES